MSSPFFSTLTAFRRKMSTQFEPLIIHHRKSVNLVNRGLRIFLLSYAILGAMYFYCYITLGMIILPLPPQYLIVSSTIFRAVVSSRSLSVASLPCTI